MIGQRNAKAARSWLVAGLSPARAARVVRALLCGGVGAVMLAGCGFHPAGSTGKLPPAMKVTYVQSGEPYGHLENLLRRAIVARGLDVTKNPDQASAELDILDTHLKRRVLAVNSRGQPLEYDLHYTVRFGLVNQNGQALLIPQSIDLNRHLAYNIHIELGSTRRREQLEQDMQREAVRLIMLRLEALQGDRVEGASRLR